nr:MULTISPECIES: choice-of-anchor L domain-containing protein [unclassified Dolichospermum]
MTAPNTDNLVSSLIGSGVEVTNAEYTGDSRAAGIFNDPSLGIGIDSGIILSTGDVANIYGPNNSDSTGTAFATDGDTDLNGLVSPSATRDAAVLEFDFTPTESFISFQYVFASEEYNEYVNSSFNDVFGFFITDSQGNKQNIAVIPGTNTPIAINNVNLGSNSGYYRNNDPSDYGFGNTPFNIGFDGLTTPLTAVASVTPGQTYHFKLAIADNSDSVYDSAVFIKNGGFISTPLVSVNDAANTYQETPITINVLGNDIVPSGETPSISNFQQVSDNGGSVTLSDNGTPDNLADDQLVYTPPTGFSGVDQFEYTLADSQGNTSIAQVSIQVQPTYQQYTFTYTYGNGDSYSGYGYAAQGTYTVGQVLDGYTNETGNPGYYTIDSVDNAGTGNNNYVYVTSYTDGDTGYGTTNSISLWGYSGLGSEYGYAYNANYSGDTLFNSYYEADLPAVLQVRLNLLADNDGIAGEIISNDQVGLNRSFFVEIQVGDLRGNAAGVNGLGLNLAWDGLILESIDTPFDPTNIITANFPLLQDGTVDNSSGLINNLSGGSLPAFELGQAIGVNQLERFALLRFQTENSTGTYYFTTTVDNAALADDNPYYSLDVETSQPIFIGSVYNQYNFTYNYGNLDNLDSYTGYVYAVEGTYTPGQTIGNIDNETGNYGYYTIGSIASTTLDSSYNNHVYVTSYTDGDTGFGTTTNISGYGYSGLGSEYGYAYDASGNSSDPYFSPYYEADILANQKYNFTYSYGNGDSYSGYGYAAVGTYTAGQTIGGIANETNLYPGGTGAVENNTLGSSWGMDSVYHLSYTFTNVSDALTLNFIGSGLQEITDESWGLDNVKVTAGGFNYSNDFESDSVTGWSSSTRSTTPVGSRNFLGEFGNDTVSLALNDVALNGSVTVEFDLFIINSWDGNGTTFGAGPDKFTVNTSDGQTLLNTTFANYPGELQSYPGAGQSGQYTIDSVELGNTNAGYNGYVYVTSYTDGDTGFGAAGYLSSGTGYYGLGSEYGYAYDANGYSSDPYFSQYYEADIQNQLFNYTYTYGNGDSYSGYGYAAAGTYTAGQVLDGYANETGNTGYYTIDSESAGTTDSSYNNRVYVTSYTDGDTGYGETTNLYSYDGGSGLGSEYGYAYTADGYSYDSYFSPYSEADLVIPDLAITDNSGNANDSSIKFTTELSKFRKGYQDSDYVRPNYADTTKYFDITNTGTGVLVVSDIQINVSGVTVNLDLSGDKDLFLNAGSSQRVNLTYDPLVAGENFDLTNGLVLFTNIPNWSQYEVALSGKSTFNSDINYDGKVNTGDLGSLNQAKKNFDNGIFDATADITGDGFINTLDASALTADIKLKLSV